MRFVAPLVWLAVIQVFVLALLASSPELHERVHTDAHESGHHCLSTDFKSGTVEQTMVAPLAAPEFLPVPIGTVAISAAARHTLPVHLCGSLLEHGPPALA